jgi:hypothetical protein
MGIHGQEDIFKYMSGDLPLEEVARIEGHLRSCSECADLLTFAREFNAALKQMPPEEFHPATPCPDVDTIAAFAAGDLDEDSAQSVRRHTILCKDCLEEVFLLRRSAKEAGVRVFSESSSVPIWLREILEKAEGLIELAKTYGHGAIIGPARIIAEQPAFAMRTVQSHKGTSKVFEISVGGNAYTIEVVAAAAGSLSFDVAGIRTSVQEPLHLSFHAEDGEELVTVTSNKEGNCRFRVPSGSKVGGLCLLTLKLKDSEEHLVFRLPEI